jgi:hypothetical protein
MGIRRIGAREARRWNMREKTYTILTAIFLALCYIFLTYGVVGLLAYPRTSAIDIDTNEITYYYDIPKEIVQYYVIIIFIGALMLIPTLHFLLKLEKEFPSK